MVTPAKGLTVARPVVVCGWSDAGTVMVEATSGVVRPMVAAAVLAKPAVSVTV